jgi:hypothetical protein
MGFLLHPRPLLLIAIFLFIALALCGPVPQGTVWVTETLTSTVGALAPTSTPAADVTTCVGIKGRETTALGVKLRFRTEPSGRGTIGILVSCSATYIFCVWTTVAPAVNETGKKRLRIWYKLVLTSIAIIVPAGVMIYALDEHRQASDLVAAWAKYLGPDPPKEEPAQGGVLAKIAAWVKHLKNGFLAMGARVVSWAKNPDWPWRKKPDTSSQEQEIEKKGDFVPLDIGAAFFVLMGGFRVENNRPEDYKEKTKIRSPKKLAMGGQDVYDRPILTAHGFVEYIKANYITPETFNQADVLDKGKGSNIAKIFAGLQALWLILQSLARWADNLPLTLLEIHVLIQIVCTSVIYFYWFRKPLDVGVPTTIHLSNPKDRRLNAAQQKAKEDTVKAKVEADAAKAKAEADAAAKAAKAKSKAKSKAKVPKDNAEAELAQAQAQPQAHAQTQAQTGAQTSSQRYSRGFETPEPYSPGHGFETLNPYAHSSRPESTTSRAASPSYAGSTVYGGASRGGSPVPGMSNNLPARSNTVTSHATTLNNYNRDTNVISAIDPNAEGAGGPVADSGNPKGDNVIKREHLADRNSLYKEAILLPLKTAEQVQTTWAPVTAKAFLDVVAHVRPIYNDEKKPDNKAQTEPVQHQHQGQDKNHNPEERTPSWRKLNLSSEVAFTARMVIIQGFLVVLVSSLHLGAWFTQFPTTLEMWFWRASCFGMIGFPTWIVAVICFNDYDKDMFDILWRTHLRDAAATAAAPTSSKNVLSFALGEIHDAIRIHSFAKKDRINYDNTGPASKKDVLSGLNPRKVKMVQHYIMLYSCVISAIIYVIASLFITVESFISLRWLSDKDFMSPQWSNFVPHL